MHELPGCGIVQVLASTDPWEPATIYDRVCVFYKERLSTILKPPRLEAHALLEAMNTGVA